MNGPLYELENIEQRYDGRRVLRIEQLSIKRGEILAIVGPSGAGKSTLLRLLNFLEPATAGRILFDGVPASPELGLEQRRRVTTVFQNPMLLRRSVAGNLGYGLWLRGQKLSPAEQAKWLGRLGMAEQAGQSARSLSGGEAQRVALGRALVLAPDVLLLDEPTANLDRQNAATIETILKEEHARRGTTMVLVTHNILQARRLAQRTGLLVGGELVEVADTEEFFAAPREAETAAFVRADLVF